MWVGLDMNMFWGLNSRSLPNRGSVSNVWKQVLANVFPLINCHPKPTPSAEPVMLQELPGQGQTLMRLLMMLGYDVIHRLPPSHPRTITAWRLPFACPFWLWS